MTDAFNTTQKRALAVITVIALLVGAYFLRGFFVLIVVAAVFAYLFTPLYERLRRRLSTGLSATITLLAAVLMVAVPIAGIVFLAIVQITHMVNAVSDWVAQTDLSTLGDRTLKLINDLLSQIPFLNINVTADSLRQGIITVSQRVGEWLLQLLQGAAGSVVAAIAAAIIFLYVFISLLVNREKIRTLIRQLNPLGEEITDLYLAKTGAMVRGTVKGQFVIALCQGVSGAISIYIAGFHDGFFIFAILLTALSVIPLGGGIVTIPFGIGMMFFGNIIGGAFVVIFHVVVVTNIDNFLRPILVPKQARLDPALMLLAVFSGIALWGFWGIVIGPVLMIIIVTTISVYLSVYKGVPITDPDDEEEKPRRPKLFSRLANRIKQARNQDRKPAKSAAR
ncbi:AI-2E family transporter [Mycolicibacterium elephantis]|uniref:AI-2E family transporter n=1 Tax=Mycolicibacterium elephantis TaxID=81858 RepID=A0A1A0QPU9_9MYCO|nr:AI-2E family transporter [Mycolicibacterium elephantis]OBA87092.1 AI-2E family transporter [Mycolicibacterium elephantis]OBB23948.1 AI-2E family transporter [Mycolicibacterium elephantis]OBE91836.1 AI-2E family transporter [Mycolicibacterium elephantis]ORA69117.1 AI-2E family transporter [Mycolicibacterium elephantis]